MVPIGDFIKNFLADDVDGPILAGENLNLAIRRFNEGQPPMALVDALNYNNPDSFKKAVDDLTDIQGNQQSLRDAAQTSPQVIGALLRPRPKPTGAPSQVPRRQHLPAQHI